MVERLIRACDCVTAPDECMCRVEGVAWAKTGSGHQRSRPIHHRTIGEQQLKGQRVHRAPGARQAPPHDSHCRLRVRSILRKWILDTIVTQPREDQPVGQLVEHQRTDHAAIDRHLCKDSLTPVLDRGRRLRALCPQVHIEKICVEIAATQGARTARSSPEWTSSGRRPARTPRARQSEACPAEPAVLAHARAGSGRLVHSAPDLHRS